MCDLGISNVNFISKCYTKNKYFHENGKNNDVNDGFYMTMIACDRIKLKEHVCCYLLYKTLSAGIRLDQNLPR